MDELSIKVNIAGRPYPLTIKREEEETIRKAAKEIDRIISDFQSGYAVKDKQDLLAMTALQLATRNLVKGKDKDYELLKNQLTEINHLLDKHLG